MYTVNYNNMPNVILLFVHSFGRKKKIIFLIQLRRSVITIILLIIILLLLFIIIIMIYVKVITYLRRSVRLVAFSGGRQTIAQVYCFSPRLSVSSGLQLQLSPSGQRLSFASQVCSDQCGGRRS